MADNIRLAIDGFSFLLILFVGVYSWQAARHRATIKVTDDLGRRLATLETRMEALPTADDVHELTIASTKLSGDLNTAVARMDGLEKIVERVERIVNRQEDHLLNQPKGGA